MRFRMFFSQVLMGGLVLLTGCAGARDTIVSSEESRSFSPKSATDPLVENTETDKQPEPPRHSPYLTASQPGVSTLRPKFQPQRLPVIEDQRVKHPIHDKTIQPVSHETNQPSEVPLQKNATLQIDGRLYRVQLVEEASVNATLEQLNFATADSESIPAPSPLNHSKRHYSGSGSVSADTFPNEAIPLNLTTALSMIGGQHPTVGFAQWRVQEAYARFDQAKVLWLPSIQPGFSFHDHDGNYQASDGSIVDVDRNSFQYGLGAGATGAGTTPRPGVVAQFHLADAIFQPDIAEKTAWARGHAANGVLNEQLLAVAIAYLELLDSEQDLRIIEETHDRTSGLSKLTEDFAATGQGLQSDADRLETELILVKNRLLSAQERSDVASARLAQALSIDAGRRITPLDPTVVPIELVSLDVEKQSLISTGLATRPELKEAQALVAAAIEQYNRQRYAPFVPSVLLGFSNGGFGGGLGNNLSNINDRVDFDALATWEIRNLGFGEGAARRQSNALIEQARFENVRRLDQVAREIVEAHSQVIYRVERIEITKGAIQSATNSYQRNLGRIRDGHGLPLEVLQSVRALEDARRAYLKAVIEYNQAQFRLQWALGWPVNAVRN